MITDNHAKFRIGMGKSTLGRQLHHALGIELVELYELHWNDGWVETPPEEFLEKVHAAIEGLDEFIMDGNYRYITDSNNGGD